MKPETTPNEEIVRRANEIYSAAAAKHGITSSAVLLDRQNRQILRFSDIAHWIDLNNTAVRLLDVGCGNAELYKYLAGRGYRGSYVGVDINEDLLAQARTRFKAIDVRCVDLLKDEFSEKFDFVVMSGLFNSDYGQDANWVQAFISRMYELSEQTLVFNALSTYVNSQEQTMFYLDPLMMLDFCIRYLSRRVTLAHHNVSYNYTIAVFRGSDAGLPCEE